MRIRDLGEKHVIHATCPGYPPIVLLWRAKEAPLPKVGEVLMRPAPGGRGVVELAITRIDPPGSATFSDGTPIQ